LDFQQASVPMKNVLPFDAPPAHATYAPALPPRPDDAIVPSRLRRHRTIFVSDTHLGTRGAKAELLYDFLIHNECETLYLVGDIIDGWRLMRRWYWSAAHSRVLDEILRKVKNGTRIVFVPGNHDEAFRPYCGVMLAGVELKSECVHVTADGRKLLVLHGDRFDGVVTYAKWLAHLGDTAYEIALKVNTLVSAVRRALGLPYWSLSAYLKHKVKNAASFISDFEQAVAREARSRGVDGVVCGHIHHPEVKDIGGVLYCNDGDWVESCTALTETVGGQLEILPWVHSAAEQERFVDTARSLRKAAPSRGRITVPA
jgi:UDP-2,3-diacylglucosamine pyrophosphatase LpxH